MSDRIEIIARTERRRKFSDAEKAAILDEADQDGVSVREVAKRHSIAESLIYNWRSARRQAAALASERAAGIHSVRGRSCSGGRSVAPDAPEASCTAHLDRDARSRRGFGPPASRYTQDGRLEIDNNPAENALRGIALGRKNWIFAGADCGGDRAANMYSLLETAKLNGVNPQDWLTDVLDRIGKGHPISRIDELLPWKWAAQPT